ncbi:capping protein inhibiting regulator of actin dynamics isoform X1 [Gadus macrocephalus]|uniref:capping protein inhibiting regulator of actin dynamics isoform X1 n=2 Tax=Gadus macrocephalus TaxID=80720 RepID=UPI0028CB77E8|nr:capping protein inhibiting regulator of actin dynamics isoform X1 [Gadus macrocephalus]
MATDARETKHDTHVEVTVSKGPERRQQGKFQPFRRLFGKRKKRETERNLGAVELKDHFSTGEVCNGVVSENEEILRELNPVVPRAISHDSIFTPEELPKEAVLDQTMSQENVSDKVRNLQRQIAQGIKFGKKPLSLRKSEDECSSDEEELPQSPLKVIAHVETMPAETEPKVQLASQQAPVHSPPLKSPRSKRVLPPTGTIESINLDAVPQCAPCLDNTAAKHKLSVKPKNQRISRKHRRFTQELQDSIPGVLQEDDEVAGGFAAEEHCLQSLESSNKQQWQQEVEEERIRQEEEERAMKAEEKRLRKLDEERCSQVQEEERIHRAEVEERKQRELETERRRREKEEDERRIREEEECKQREEERKQEAEEEEEEERRRIQEEQERLQWEEENQERKHQQEQRIREEEERRQQEVEVQGLLLEEKRIREEREKQERKKRLHEEKFKTEEDEKKKKEEEEIHWREMEERQRPFSFKVSSGEKQILFQKVNLTPVTPASGHQGGAVTDQRAGNKTSSPDGADPHNLMSCQYVPHTAILVTGAQLCGPAVNLDQIKDTACKSLLGIGEDWKAQGTPPTKSKTSPDRKSGKTKSLNESMLTSDQSSAAVLAEWASIRSKIFKGADEGKYEDCPETSKSQTGPGGEDANQSSFPHSNLRKTMSVSAKFSITPAKKKFGDSNRNSELLSPEEKETVKEGAFFSDTCSQPQAASPTPAAKSPNRTNKTVRIAVRGTEECMFAKDLPSFLVPSHQAKPEGMEMKGHSQDEAEGSEGSEERGPDSQDKTSPFGIKLRRTNYSLRFHSEQSIEKRKKRYSAGDSFDGVPSPLTPMDPDSTPDSTPVFSETPSPPSPLKDGAMVQFLQVSPSSIPFRTKPGPKHDCDGEKVPSRSSLYQRPLTSPKPAAAAFNPPPSPLPKDPSEAVAQGSGRGPEPSGKEQGEAVEETTAVARLQRGNQVHTPGDEEPKEKKSFFPSINIPWREKVDRKTELLKKEKPSLQSRHSLDSARLQEKEQGPLWITLALQKQKGFREQQQSRDERRSQREAKLAEKQSKERESQALLVSPTDGRGTPGPRPGKALTPEEPKRPDSLLGRFDRREHLKKANTLPSSVTVEIADSTSLPPAVKEVSKRFSSSDSPQVCTEPAWLALAKRKAKAWSDCPQIIK